mmetsp:Transcript_6987/g.11023  ORF Transcript_6987/g.11023 Transcript_6987/m.11023 type:complete len:94 (+) Transcript_6987:501-782(+)
MYGFEGRTLTTLVSLYTLISSVPSLLVHDYLKRHMDTQNSVTSLYQLPLPNSLFLVGISGAGKVLAQTLPYRPQKECLSLVIVKEPKMVSQVV